MALQSGKCRGEVSPFDSRESLFRSFGFLSGYQVGEPWLTLHFIQPEVPHRIRVFVKLPMHMFGDVHIKYNI